MSEPERLEIPTPWGKRRVWCSCDKDKYGKMGQCLVACLGCDYADGSPHKCSAPVKGNGECPPGTIYEDQKCDKCRYFPWVYLSKDDEPMEVT